MGKIYNDSRKVIIWTKLITKQIDSFAIISKDSDMTAAKSAINIAKKFTRSGFHVKLISPLISKHFDTVSISDNLSDSNIKCIIVVGGDGTILKTVRLMKQQIPILGINFGGRGILTELTPVEISKAIEKIKHGEIFFDRRKRIKLFLNSNKSVSALNEVYIERYKKLRSSYFEIYLDSYKLKQKMDGLIISTPTGSTGHALSLGSSILNENLSALMLTPIAPISRIPPFALPLMDISIIPNDDAYVIVDGQVEFQIKAHDKISIKKHNSDTIFLRFDNSPIRQLNKFGF